MSSKRKSWQEKFGQPQEPRVVDTPPKMQKRFGSGKMLIATPLLVDAVIREVPYGKLVTINQIRARLARDFNADSTCPLTTGIFVRIAAEKAEEDLRLNRMTKEQITPCWRVIRDDGSLNDKFPGGVEAQAQRLKEEGHIIELGKGKKPSKIKDYEKYLTKL